MDYVMSDIHGMYELMDKMLINIRFSNSDRLYILGDNIDRGKNSVKVLQLLLDNRENMFSIKGNHEYMMLDHFDDFGNIQKYLLWAEGNGGNATLKGLQGLPESRMDEMIEFVRSFPPYFIVGSNILIHGGVDFALSRPGQDVKAFLAAQDPYQMVWMREKYIFSSQELPGYRIFSGHTGAHFVREWLGLPQARAQILETGSRVYMDLQSYATNHLACYCLNTSEVFYVSGGESVIHMS